MTVCLGHSGDCLGLSMPIWSLSDLQKQNWWGEKCLCSAEGFPDHAYVVSWKKNHRNPWLTQVNRLSSPGEKDQAVKSFVGLGHFFLMSVI